MRKNVVKLILFLMYTIGIFVIAHPLVILWGLGINSICMLLQKTSIRKTLRNLWTFMPFIIFTGIINVWVVNVYYGGTIAIKLILVCNITYIFASRMTYTEMARTIGMLLTPLQWFKMDINRIEIIIVISLSFIPILKQDLSQVRLALKAKAAKTDTFHLILQSKWVLLPILSSILKRMNEMEYSLKVKAYENES